MRHDLIRLFNKSVHGPGIRHGKLQVEQFFFLKDHFHYMSFPRLEQFIIPMVFKT
jgi:hypothetical protein